MTDDNFQIEFDDNRGVLWVHYAERGTVLRICGLPRDLVVKIRQAIHNIGDMADVTVLDYVGKNPGDYGYEQETTCSECGDEIAQEEHGFWFHADNVQRDHKAEVKR